VLLEIGQHLTPIAMAAFKNAIIKMTGGGLGIVTGRAMLYSQRVMEQRSKQ
jgi:hypothetical protein